MQATFWGVRGSIPTPGQHTFRWGGNTSCVEVRHADLPPLVLDCGTGARDLGGKLLGERGRALELVFTHHHMDHVFGFPFFAPLYTPGYAIRVTAPAYSPDETREKLARYLNGTYHPARLREVPARLEWTAIRPGAPFERGGYRLVPFRLNHPGDSVGYRIEADGASIAYVTDTAPFARPGEGLLHGEPGPSGEQRLVEWLEGCQVVVFDTMYTREEYFERMTWGHAYPEYAHAVCEAAGVAHLVLFHHSPDRSDDELDQLAAAWSSATGPRVTLAREGETVVAEPT